MGNYASCFKTQNSRLNMAKLVDSQGQLRFVELPLTAAELMLEYPGFILCPVDDLRRTRRLSAMKADECLLGRKVYLLTPVDKVNSWLSELQLAAIDSVCSSAERAGKRTRAGSKVSPGPVVATGLPGENIEGLVKDLDLGGESTGQTGQRMRLGKGWAPTLEPIVESC